MGRRTEVRIAKHMPVLVHGTDSRGIPFTVTAHAHDISGSGASLTGLNGVGLAGTKIDLEYQGRRARYRIQWVGKEGTARANQVGLRCLEPGNYIWGVPLPDWAEDTFDPAVEPARRSPQPISPLAYGAPAAAAQSERRHFPRHACRIEAVVAIEGTSMDVPAKVTDLSMSGCYMEMLSPLPVETFVEVTLNPGDTILHVHGRVRSSQMGMGMGVAFTSVAPEDFEKLRKLAPPSITAPEPARPAPAPPRAQIEQRAAAPPKPAPANHPSAPGMPQARPATTSDALEAVVRVLFRKGILSRSELAEELEKLLISKS
jgi:PilZ domain